jgi:hypothetical protein
VKCYVTNYIMPKWGKHVADKIGKRELRDWLYALRDDEELAGPTVSKIKSIIGTIYNWGEFEGLVTTNPADRWKLEDVASNYTAVIVKPEAGEKDHHAALKLAPQDAGPGLRVNGGSGVRGVWSEME